MPWKKGQSGNRAGRPKKGNALAEILRDHLDTQRGKSEKTKGLAFIEKLYNLSMGRSPQAIMAAKLILNYCEGMPKTSFDIRSEMKLEGRMFIEGQGGVSIAQLHKLAAKAEKEEAIKERERAIEKREWKKNTIIRIRREVRRELENKKVGHKKQKIQSIQEVEK